MILRPQVQLCADGQKRPFHDGPGRGRCGRHSKADNTSCVTPQCSSREPVCLARRARSNRERNGPQLSFEQRLDVQIEGRRCARSAQIVCVTAVSDWNGIKATPIARLPVRADEYALWRVVAAQVSV